MVAYSRPGVYGEEILNPPTPNVGASTTAIAAFAGASDKGPETATTITSWNQYVSLYGGFNSSASNALPLAVYTAFKNGAREVSVLRVTAGSPVAATRSVNDRVTPTAAPTLSITAVNVGAWGNNVYFDILAGTTSTTFDLIVKYGGTSSSYIVERYSDLSMESNSGRYAIPVVNSQSSYVVLADLNSTATGANKMPTLIAGQPLASGANGSAPSASQIASALSAGYSVITRPMVFNAPGVTSSSDISSIVSWAEGRGDVFVVIDPVDGNSGAQTSAIASYPASSYAAIYFPYISIPDPINTVSGTLRRIPPGGAVIGQFLATDASRGVFKAPAGVTNVLTGVADVDFVSASQQDTLYTNSPAVNVIKYVPGNGICIYGARTTKGGSVDKFVPVRRTLIQLKKALTEILQFAVFEPNDARTWRAVDNRISAYLNQFWQIGGLRGTSTAQAFFVKVDEENNPLNVVENGELHVEVGVALQRPAEFVVFRLSQYDGGVYFTEA